MNASDAPMARSPEDLAFRIVIRQIEDHCSKEHDADRHRHFSHQVLFRADLRVACTAIMPGFVPGLLMSVIDALFALPTD
jgi:hypothetical protein